MDELTRQYGEAIERDDALEERRQRQGRYSASLIAAAESARMESLTLLDMGRAAESRRAWRLADYLAEQATAARQ